MQNGWLREGDVLNKSLLAKQQTMHKSQSLLMEPLIRARRVRRVRS